MEAKPTPGPWTLDFDLGHVDGANGEIVCYLARGPSEESKANGHLIAAAPKMADLLVRAYTHVTHGGPTRGELEDVLRKAGLIP